jgi:cytochrome b561
MAFCMLGTAALMYYMVNIGDLEDPVLRAEYSFLMKQHKSIGLIVLFLVVFRFFWNRLRARPPVPVGFTGVQYRASQASHYFLYAAMLIVPLLGWMASMTYGARTFFFGLFELPVWLPKNMDWAYVLQPAHIWGAWIMFGVVAIHVTAALWHHFVRRDATLVQMLPDTKQASSDEIRSEVEPGLSG